MKNKDTRMEPCGTPIVMFRGFDNIPFQPTHCFLLQRYNVNHKREFSQILKAFKLYNNTLWLTVSNALLGSINNTVNLSSSMCLSQRLTKLFNAVSNEGFGLKPD